MSDLYTAIAQKTNDLIQQAKNIVLPPPTIQPVPLIYPATPKDLPWMELAKKEIGVTEIPGSGNNPRILYYHSFCTLKASYDSVSWCSAYANAMLQLANMGGSKSAAALDWLGWGIELKYAVYGCLSIWDWGNGHGHVGFIMEATDQYLKVLGGNQLDRADGKDKVCVKNFPWSLAPVSFKWPKKYPLPEGAEVDNG